MEGWLVKTYTVCMRETVRNDYRITVQAENEDEAYLIADRNQESRGWEDWALDGQDVYELDTIAIIARD